MSKISQKKLLIVSTLTVTCVFLTALTVAILFDIFYLSLRFLPNTYIGNVYVGQLDSNEAERKLSDENSTKQTITLSVNDKTYTISDDEIGLSINNKVSVQKALVLQKSHNFFDAAKAFAGLSTDHNVYPIDYTLNVEMLNEFVDIVYAQSTIDPTPPIIAIKDGVVVITNGEIGTTFDKSKVIQDITKNIKANNFSPVAIELTTIDPRISDSKKEDLYLLGQKFIGKSIVLTETDTKFTLTDSDIVSFLGIDDKYNTKAINAFIKEKVVPVINKDPQNAIFTFENGKVTQFVPSKEGVVLDNDLLKSDIINLIDKLENATEKSLTASIPVQKESAEIATEKVNDLGIKERIGRGTSSFKGSIPGRIHNVGLAASKFNGVLVAPGDTLSFNNILGDVSTYTGYKQAYVIRDGRTVLGDGGGVCQVSTTLFRAALNAGLPIVERRPHSYRVGYYEQGSPPGLDATVFAPSTDFKIKNDTEHHILIQTQFDAKAATLVFELYGTNDGRIVELTKPVTTSSVAPPEDAYIDDPTLPTGKINQVEHKAWGAKVVFDYTVTKVGEDPIKKTFVSTYRPWGAVFMRGTGPVN